MLLEKRPRFRATIEPDSQVDFLHVQLSRTLPYIEQTPLRWLTVSRVHNGEISGNTGPSPLASHGEDGRLFAFLLFSTRLFMWIDKVPQLEYGTESKTRK